LFKRNTKRRLLKLQKQIKGDSDLRKGRCRKSEIVITKLLRRKENKAMNTMNSKVIAIGLLVF